MIGVCEVCLRKYATSFEKYSWSIVRKSWSIFQNSLSIEECCRKTVESDVENGLCTVFLCQKRNIGSFICFSEHNYLSLRMEK